MQIVYCWPVYIRVCDYIGPTSNFNSNSLKNQIKDGNWSYFKCWCKRLGLRAICLDIYMLIIIVYYYLPEGQIPMWQRITMVEQWQLDIHAIMLYYSHEYGAYFMTKWKQLRIRRPSTMYQGESIDRIDRRECKKEDACSKVRANRSIWKETKLYLFFTYLTD